MAWGHGKDKKARFDNSQLKKSINAGLLRMPESHEIVISCDFVGTFEQFIDKQMDYISYSESFYNIKSAMLHCKNDAISMMCSGNLKLASGEEIRKYIPKNFGDKK